jgi:maleate isomerase
VPDTTAPRGKWGVLVPASNTVVEPELNTLRPTGLSFMASRIINDDMTKFAQNFEEFLDLSVLALEPAVRAIMKASPDYMIIGYSGIGWRRGADDSVRRRLEDLSGIGVTTPGSAFLAALKHLGLKTIAIISPYPVDFLSAVDRFFVESGHPVARHIRVPCATAIEIANVSERALIDAVHDANGEDVDAIVQVGGNLPMLPVAETCERWLGKPVLSMTSVLLWHALRSNGLADVIEGGGMLLTRRPTDTLAT